MAPGRLEQRRRLPRPASTGIPAPMATDWSDPEQAERELRRRERGEVSGDDSPSDMRLLLGAMHAVLKAQKQTDTQTAGRTEDIATLRGLLAPLEHARSAAQQPAAESGLATQLAQAEGRIAGHVDRLAERVRPVEEAMPQIRELAQTAAATPGELENIKATIERSVGAVRGQTTATNAHTNELKTLKADINETMRATEQGMTGRFAEEAKSVRNVLNETTAVVLSRRRRSRWFWLTLAGVVALAMLAGVWVQWKYAPVPAQDPTGGWRDGIWNDYGPAIRDCILEAIKTGRTVSCPIRPPPS